jgi:hypothetical protein
MSEGINGLPRASKLLNESNLFTQGEANHEYTVCVANVIRVL